MLGCAASPPPFTAMNVNHFKPHVMEIFFTKSHEIRLHHNVHINFSEIVTFNKS